MIFASTRRELTALVRSTFHQTIAQRLMASTSYPRPTAERASELAANLADIRSRVQQAAKGANFSPILVAVSKYKPAEDVMGCYEDGQRDFGENYAGELAEKAAALPADIRWHFIGTLQSNKCKPLAAIPNLYAIQTLDSAKKATALDRALPPTRTEPLNVFIQVNTSAEDSKSGLVPLLSSPEDDATTSSEVVSLARHIVKECPRLRLKGLMTIGSIDASVSDGPNQDFERLVRTRDTLKDVLAKDGFEDRLELSMGMSADFEDAIRAGSGYVRVGTSVFGARKKA
ncbi:hypothetical protein BOTBODRAFT_33569 [Botryobasidium botryosum FD-172 SS1]|uniref:Pyridoxal phosphate homeostasis protein n=1 Tax=Botryobasidium botryosum (strain FD-172 SS1) TaxID=930990 RepID=A0A067MPN9_BOTB1|nr:hypothetical protein BOTBODRAFT_33569 [Botryobasidium botryosum FD-172 SS1]